MASIRKSTRKILIALAGFPIIIIGIILIPLPGPGILVIILGLLILSCEFEWANRHLDKVKETQKKAMNKARGKRNSTNDKNAKN